MEVEITHIASSDVFAIFNQMIVPLLQRTQTQIRFVWVVILLLTVPNFSNLKCHITGLIKTPQLKFYEAERVIVLINMNVVKMTNQKRVKQQITTN